MLYLALLISLLPPPDDFDALVEQVRRDYPGYEAKVTPELVERERAARTRLAAEPQKALAIYNEYLDFFDDDHLRVTSVGSGEPEMWTAWPYEEDIPANKLRASSWEGEVFEIHGANRYYVRKTDDPVRDKATILTYRPRHPNGRNVFPIAHTLSDSTFYMRLTSFAVDKESIDTLVEKHRAEITSRPNLIIDIRSNLGGRSDVYEALLPLLYTHPYELVGVEWYASSGNIADLERALASGEIREGDEDQTAALLEEMKRHRGKFVLRPGDEARWTVCFDEVCPRPRRVGIIIEGQNASAAEQFLLTARHSDKVLLFGSEPTAGTLDYSNTVPRKLPSGRFELWMPQTRSLRLPENPIDETGIAPDVQIPFEPEYQLYDRLDDWVYFVKNYLEEINN